MALVLTLTGCARLEHTIEHARAECDATPGVKVSLSEQGWRISPTLTC